jgi:hypothetical protein
MGPILTLFVLGIQNQAIDLDKYVYPLARPLPSPMVTVDTSDAPETAAVEIPFFFSATELL